MRKLGLVTAILYATSVTSHVRLQAQTPPSTDEVVARLTHVADSLAARDEFSGVVVLAKDGVPVLQKTYGYADRAAKKPNTLETQFALGSINKIFTKTALRQLVADGKISLDSTLAHYLPDYPNQDAARRITVQQLRDMRAGLGGDIFGTPPGGKRTDIRKLSDFVPLFANEPLAFEPGKDMKYCNVCYVLLGLIIEKVSGQSYYDYVRTHIYEPAGMSHTMHIRSDALPATAAIGYTRNNVPNAKLGPNTELLPGIGSSAGGGYSTAGDLLKFLNALRASRIPEGPAAGQVGIAGGAEGMNGVMEGSLAGKYDLIVLANMDPPVALTIAKAMRDFLEPGN